jgi:hypothetical protein
MERLQKGGLPSPHGYRTGEAVANGFAPQYVFSPRLVGHLACGELAIEPVLGPVRVAKVLPAELEHAHMNGGPGEEPHVHITWRDEHGPGTATGRYPPDRSLDVRIPSLTDRLLVRRSIDQARWLKREIPDNTARLIAAHLHPGLKSALHGFTVDGSIDELLYDELEATAHYRHYAREWVDALARYCLNREDTGPLVAWSKDKLADGEARAEEWLTEAGVNVNELEAHATADGNDNGRQADNGKRYESLLARKTIKTEMAAQLIDAAFIMGIEAGRTRARTRRAWSLIRKHVTIPAA